MRSLRFLLWFHVSLVLLLLAACTSSPASKVTTGQGTNPTSVMFTEAPTTMGIGSTATIDASAIYPASDGIGMNTAVNYTLSCGSTSCGTFTPTQMVGAVTYMAPQTIPSGGTVTITATSQQDSAVSTQAVITITPPPPPQLTFVTPVQGTVQVAAQAQYAVTINGDTSATPQVNWTLSCGGPECGSLSATVTTSGMATTFTAPATVPAGQVVTLTATSVSTPSDAVSTTMAILPAQPALANGSYAFQLQGSQLQGNTQPPIADGGVFTVASGAVTGGEEDLLVLPSCNNSYGGCSSAQSSTHKVIGGSAAANSNGSETITLQLDSGTTQSFTGVLRSSAQGFATQIDGVAASASLWPQTSTAAPTGGYALTLSGQSNGQGPAWMTGVLNIDGSNNASGNGSVLDIQAANLSYGGQYAVAATAVTAPDTAGRIVFALTPAASDTNPFAPVYVAGYIIDSEHIALVETGNQTDNINFQGMLLGMAISQGTQTGAFTAAQLANAGYVFGALGVPGGNGNEFAGALTFNASGGVTGELTISDLTGSQQQQPRIVNGSYSVASDGRVQITNLTDGSIVPYSLVLDLAGSGRAMALIYFGSGIAGGEAYLRATPTFSATSLNGNYGLNVNLQYNNPSNLAIPPLTALGFLSAIPSSSTVAIGGYALGAQSESTTSANTSGNVVTGTVTPASNGVLSGTLTGLNMLDAQKAGQFTLYQIDSAHAVLIENDSVQQTLGLLAAQP